MKKFDRRTKSISLLLALVFVGVQLPVKAAQASIVRTEQVLATTTTKESMEQREKIRRFLAREDVRTKMVAMGVNPQEAEARVASLSDVEAAKFAQKIDELPAGQDAVGAIVAGILIVFIVLLITDIVGLTRVFPWTRPINAR